jgi:hypothetical protein
MSDDTTDKLKNLMALKKYEQPEDGFIDNFVSEFRERQRRELLKSSSFTLFKERFQIWFSGLVEPRYAAATVLAIVLLGFALVFFLPKKTASSAPAITEKMEAHPKEKNAVVVEAVDMLSDRHSQPMPVGVTYFTHEDMLAADDQTPDVMQVF